MAMTFSGRDSYTFNPRDVQHLGSLYGQDFYLDRNSMRVVDAQLERDHQMAIERKNFEIDFLKNELGEVKTFKKSLEKTEKLKNLIAHYYQRK